VLKALGLPNSVLVFSASFLYEFWNPLCGALTVNLEMSGIMWFLVEVLHFNGRNRLGGSQILYPFWLERFCVLAPGFVVLYHVSLAAHVYKWILTRFSTSAFNRVYLSWSYLAFLKRTLRFLVIMSCAIVDVLGRFKVMLFRLFLHGEYASSPIFL